MFVPPFHTLPCHLDTATNSCGLLTVNSITCINSKPGPGPLRTPADPWGCVADGRPHGPAASGRVRGQAVRVVHVPPSFCERRRKSGLSRRSAPTSPVHPRLGCQGAGRGSRAPGLAGPWALRSRPAPAAPVAQRPQRLEPCLGQHQRQPLWPDRVLSSRSCPCSWGLCPVLHATSGQRGFGLGGRRPFPSPQSGHHQIELRVQAPRRPLPRLVLLRPPVSRFPCRCPCRSGRKSSDRSDSITHSGGQSPAPGKNSN